MPEAPHTAGVRLEGFGRTVYLTDHAFAGLVAEPPSPELAVDDLVVSADHTGQIATARVSARGRWQSAATRASGSVQDAGVLEMGAGAAGDWRVHVHGLRFRWPEGTLVRVPPDNHPGDRMPVYLARKFDGDEIVMLFGVFETAPDFQEFIAPGQEIVRSDDTAAAQELELAYDHAGERWRSWHYWTPVEGGVVVVKAQALESSGTFLGDIAKTLRSSLADPI